MNTSDATERQLKWFASIREGLKKATGKTVEEWAQIAKACPETKHRAQLAWMKSEHGLGQNHASIVLEAAFPSDASVSEFDALWTDAGQRKILEAVRGAATTLPDTIETQRKSFTAFSRKVQYAAVKPAKGGGVLLGLAVDSGIDAALKPAGKESWSERLKSVTPLASPTDVDARIAGLLRQAWEKA